MGLGWGVWLGYGRVGYGLGLPTVSVGLNGYAGEVLCTVL